MYATRKCPDPEAKHPIKINTWPEIVKCVQENYGSKSITYKVGGIVCVWYKWFLPQ